MVIPWKPPPAFHKPRQHRSAGTGRYAGAIRAAGRNIDVYGAGQLEGAGDAIVNAVKAGGKAFLAPAAAKLDKAELGLTVSAYASLVAALGVVYLIVKGR